jgi:hypothetical protein
VRLQMREPLLGLVDAGYVPGGNPPKRNIDPRELIEPLAALTQDLGVRGLSKGDFIRAIFTCTKWYFVMSRPYRE